MMSWVVVSVQSVFILCSYHTDQAPDGFFDAGMLLQALKARGEAMDNAEVKASEKARRRDVGKKLRLVEY